jgi:hypothetical protein
LSNTLINLFKTDKLYNIMLYQITDKLYNIMLYQVTDKLYNIMLYQVTDKLYNIMLRQVCGFFLGTLVSSTIKSVRHDITEILLKVALNTITLTPQKKRKIGNVQRCLVNYYVNIKSPLLFYTRNTTAWESYGTWSSNSNTKWVKCRRNWRNINL